MVFITAVTHPNAITVKISSTGAVGVPNGLTVMWMARTRQSVQTRSCEQAEGKSTHDRIWCRRSFCAAPGRNPTQRLASGERESAWQNESPPFSSAGSEGMAAKTPTQNPTDIYCTVAFIHGHKDFVPCGPWCVAVFRSAQIERRVNLAATRPSVRGRDWRHSGEDYEVSQALVLASSFSN